MIRSLAYLAFGSPRAADWAEFGPEVLGLEAAGTGPDGALRFRNDDRAWRLAFLPADADELAFVGWSVDDADALAATVAALEADGVEVHLDDGELAADREVDGLAWFTDAAGLRHEVVHGQHDGPAPFVPGRPGLSFVTGDGGLGHVVLIVPDLAAASHLFVDVLGFRVSDDMDMGLHVRFLHCNPRHHTLALTEVPGMVGVHHVMVEVDDLDEVGRAYDLVQERGLPVAMTLGRHTNDLMTSFYVRTPSGFEVEFGAGGRLLPLDPPWEPEQYDAMSRWGHRPPAEPMLPGVLRPVG